MITAAGINWVDVFQGVGLILSGLSAAYAGRAWSTADRTARRIEPNHGSGVLDYLKRMEKEQEKQGQTLSEHGRSLEHSAKVQELHGEMIKSVGHQVGETRTDLAQLASDHSTRLARLEEKV